MTHAEAVARAWQCAERADGLGDALTDRKAAIAAVGALWVGIATQLPAYDIELLKPRPTPLDTDEPPTEQMRVPPYAVAGSTTCRWCGHPVFQVGAVLRHTTTGAQQCEGGLSVAEVAGS